MSYLFSLGVFVLDFQLQLSLFSITIIPMASIQHYSYCDMETPESVFLCNGVILVNFQSFQSKLPVNYFINQLLVLQTIPVVQFPLASLPVVVLLEFFCTDDLYYTIEPTLGLCLFPVILFDSFTLISYLNQLLLHSYALTTLLTRYHDIVQLLSL